MLGIKGLTAAHGSMQAAAVCDTSRSMPDIYRLGSKRMALVLGFLDNATKDNLVGTPK